MAYIGKQPVIGNFQKCDAITVVNGQAAYTMQVGGVNVNPESENHMLVSLNGVLQAPVDSFTISGSTITFASNLATGDVIDFIMLLGNVLDLGTPSDNTVTNAKIVDSTIALGKLSATGTKDATTFLRGDNTFAAPSGGGKILQVITATDSTARGSTSSSFVTGSNTLSVTITPSATSSKILVLYTGAVQNVGATNATSHFTIYRGATNLGGGSNSALGSAYINANNLVLNMSIGYLDSPSTTSATTYQVYFKNDNSTTVYLNAQGTLSSITAFEIGA